jgi:hypothetical protein
MADESSGSAESTSDEGTTLPEADLFLVLVTVTRDRAFDLVLRGDVDVGDRPRFRPLGEDSATIEGFVTEATIDDLRSSEFTLEVIENVTQAGRDRASEVGTGDRFENGRVVPRGKGRKVGGRGTARDTA